MGAGIWIFCGVWRTTIRHSDWLRVVMNRIGPELFSACFLSFVAERLPVAVGQNTELLNSALQARLPGLVARGPSIRSLAS